MMMRTLEMMSLNHLNLGHDELKPSQPLVIHGVEELMMRPDHLNGIHN